MKLPGTDRDDGLPAIVPGGTRRYAVPKSIIASTKRQASAWFLFSAGLGVAALAFYVLAHAGVGFLSIVGGLGAASYALGLYLWRLSPALRNWIEVDELGMRYCHTDGRQDYLHWSDVMRVTDRVLMHRLDVYGRTGVLIPIEMQIKGIRELIKIIHDRIHFQTVPLPFTVSKPRAYSLMMVGFLLVLSVALVGLVKDGSLLMSAVGCVAVVMVGNEYLTVATGATLMQIGLIIHYPLRRREIPLAQIASASVFNEYIRGVRQPSFSVQVKRGQSIRVTAVGEAWQFCTMLNALLATAGGSRGQEET